MRVVPLAHLAALLAALPLTAQANPEGQKRSLGRVLVACAANLDFACVLLEHSRIESGQRAEAEKRLLDRCAKGSVNSCRYLDFLLERKTPSCRSWLEADGHDRRDILGALSRDRSVFGDHETPKGNLMVPEVELDPLIDGMSQFCQKHESLQLHEALWLKTAAHGRISPDELASCWAHVRRGETEAGVRHYLNVQLDRLNSLLEPKRYGCSPPEGAYGSATITSEPSPATVYFDGRTLGETPLSREVLPAGCHVLRVVFPSGSQTTVEIEIEPGRMAMYRVYD